MGPYGGLSLRGGQQAALPLIGTWNLELGTWSLAGQISLNPLAPKTGLLIVCQVDNACDGRLLVYNTDRQALSTVRFRCVS